ncbi:extracellular solute-binding protein [Paenibacillus sp.]|uniref:extracellular solute-binding protein n=1 Tax=Paenibacillus sp. TaxID=58172 RepID=UPI0028121A7C|nr:extracellular solute-binding protein [Paenibacillus sp.]
MDFKNKRFVTTGCLVMALALLASACSPGQQGQQTAEQPKPAEQEEQEAQTPAPAADAPQAEAPTFLASETPAELSIHLLYGGKPFDKTWPVFVRAAELTNVTLNGTIPPSMTDGKEAFNLMMTSGEISDIVMTNKDNFVRYGQEGAFLPLNEYMDHAPNLKKFFDEHPEVLSFATAPDGNLYWIPFVPDGNPAQGWFIRQDWLDKLDLKAPETIEDYYNVLKAFREQDPNGNGEKDEVPFFGVSGLWSVMELLPYWDSKGGFYAKDGKVYYGPNEPAFKTGMANIAKWYAEGLIDKEIFTRGGSGRDVLFGDNLGGSVHFWFGSTAAYNDKLKDTVPGFNLQVMAPPADVNGVKKEETKRDYVGTNGWGLSSKVANPEVAMKYFDFWFTEEGRRLENFGIEGVTYAMVDGKPKFMQELIDSGNVTNKLLEIGAQLQFGFHQDFEYEKQWLNPVAAKGIEMYDANNYYMEQFPKIIFTPEEQKVYDRVYPGIKTFVEETVQKWTLGAESVEEGYDAYHQRLKDLGVDELVAIHQSAYERAVK